MAEKTPRELLQETLERSAKVVRAWPAWMRTAFSAELIFPVRPRSGSVPPARAELGEPLSD